MNKYTKNIIISATALIGCTYIFKKYLDTKKAKTIINTQNNHEIKYIHLSNDNKDNIERNIYVNTDIIDINDYNDTNNERKYLSLR